MNEYRVVRTIHHDGQEYPPGSTVDLAEENAEYLLRRGDIGTPLAQPAKAAKAEDNKEAR